VYSNHSIASVAGPVRVETAAPDPPSTPHAAYCRGLEASRRGEDLADVMLDGLRAWRLDVGLSGLAELLSNAAIGWTASEWRGSGRAEP
jgi:hypothetical protein